MKFILDMLLKENRINYRKELKIKSLETVALLFIQVELLVLQKLL